MERPRFVRTVRDPSLAFRRLLDRRLFFSIVEHVGYRLADGMSCLNGAIVLLGGLQVFVECIGQFVVVGTVYLMETSDVVAE
ncbi:MAG: hypothetical protein JSS39_06300 [Nitrospira sp.]|nr:hypothetical protein [Nitrospira sp.]